MASLPRTRRSISPRNGSNTSTPSSTWRAFDPLKIVADTANGMGGFVAPLVFAGTPFDLEILYGDLDGTFPNHPADPLNPENLVDLQRRSSNPAPTSDSPLTVTPTGSF